MQTTVADGHKFSAVRRLSRRLLDRSKNAFFTYPTATGIPYSSQWVIADVIQIITMDQ